MKGVMPTNNTPLLHPPPTPTLALEIQGPLIEELTETLQQLRVEAAEATQQQQQVSSGGV
jgi:hypothetical protein